MGPIPDRPGFSPGGHGIGKSLARGIPDRLSLQGPFPGFSETMPQTAHDVLRGIVERFPIVRCARLWKCRGLWEFLSMYSGQILYVRVDFAHVPGWMRLGFGADAMIILTLKKFSPA